VSTETTAAPRRPRNPRGEGARLRQDILDAASEILESTGSPEAITLRAVARAVGIAAPSIYAHFQDREAILDQLCADGFVEFRAALLAAIAPFDDPVERLLAGCRAYLGYSAEYPRRYRALFYHPDTRTRQRPVDPASLAQGAATLNVLVEGIAGCARAGRSASQDHFADAFAVWVALHGLATLLAEMSPDLPWPDHDQLLTNLVSRLAQLEPAGTPGEPSEPSE
jgi:AcrR family transcriptional regulator